MRARELRRLVKSNGRRLDRLERESLVVAPRAREPFDAAWTRRHFPHYFRTAEPADFHRELYPLLDQLHTRRDSKEAVIAPRDGAKSTVITFAYSLKAALERLEPYIVLLSDSSGQAEEKLADVRREIEQNDALAASYPDAVGVGRVWRSDRIELRNGAVIQAIGTGRRIRGRKAGSARPSLIIFDDVENNDSITSPTKRERAWRWATREVIPAGSAGTNFLSVGSALHPKCVAVQLGKLAGWTARVYPAVHAWPDRLDLWAEWERLLLNIADPRRRETARAFYDARRADMDAGARVYWPGRWSLYDLMTRRLEVGEGAFESEWQGVPSLVGVSEWPAEYWTRRDLYFDAWPKDLVYKVVALDPSKGASAAADYQARVDVGIEPKTGVIYVDCEFRREPAEAMIRRTLHAAREFGRWGSPLLAVLFEDNATMGLLTGAIQSVAGSELLPWQCLTNTEEKTIRILSALSSYLCRGMIRFRSTSGGRQLVEQLQEFPGSDHDDGPDALATAVRWLEAKVRR